MGMQELKPYTVEAEGRGCRSCGRGEQYEVVFRVDSEREEMLSTTYGDKEEAEDIADYCNHAYAKGNADALERERELREALEKAVWRERSDFPNNPYCILCGAGKKWADEHGHEPGCALAQ